MGADITHDRTQYPARIKVMNSSLGYRPCGFMIAGSMWPSSSRRPQPARWPSSFSGNAHCRQLNASINIFHHRGQLERFLPGKPSDVAMVSRNHRRETRRAEEVSDGIGTYESNSLSVFRNMMAGGTF